jgi:hypothetical protein
VAALEVLDAILANAQDLWQGSWVGGRRHALAGSAHRSGWNALPAAAFALPQPEAEAAYARGDYATAFKIWLPLAEQASPEAQRNVARMYERGEWVAQDKEAAMEWYRRAAEQALVTPQCLAPPTGPRPQRRSWPAPSPGRRHPVCRRRRRPIRGQRPIPDRRLPSSF